ncbi:MAG: cation:proton antiporter [Bdellovibrionales bacterium CG10_big_fil_rev_8_21_14_0_10_45_34]|nr:MAG: cation:proton antiporter [Bdellovibrionales bacterium CG10_big_fil_rev_8_21_14_0_10_45_34]
MALVTSVFVGLLFFGATYLILARSFIRLILGLSLLSNAVNLLIFTAGGFQRFSPPLVSVGGSNVAIERISDPLPQALVLTAIVISFGILSFALALTYRVIKVTRSDNMNTLSEGS